MEWSPGYLAGYTRLPNLLIASAGRLQLSQEEVVLVYAIESFNFGTDLPRPGIPRLADMLGVDEKTIRRSADRLAARTSKTGIPYLVKKYGFRKRISWNLAGLYDDLLRTDLSELASLDNVDNFVDNGPDRTEVSEQAGSHTGQKCPDTSGRSVRTESSSPDRNGNRKACLEKESRETNKHANGGASRGLSANPFVDGSIYAETFEAVSRVWRQHKGGKPIVLTGNYVNRFQKIADDVDLDTILSIMKDRIEGAGSLNYLVEVWSDPESYAGTTWP